MPWLDNITDWLGAHSPLVWWLSLSSIALFLISPIVVVWLVTKLPINYFTQTHRRALSSWDNHPPLRLFLLVAKSVLGTFLLIVGAVMLIAPGQGLLTMAAGLILLEFPGKYRAERWIATRRHVWKSLNWIRKRAGQPELKSPR